MDKPETIIIDGNEVDISRAPVGMYDENRLLIGMGTIDETIDRHLWCKSVHAWIINSKGELYLVQRSLHVMNNPGKWAESFGGYVDGDQTEMDAVKTELTEELGITIDESLFNKIGIIKQLETRYDGKIGKQFVSVYLIELDLDENIVELSERDTAGYQCMHWKTFANKLVTKEIDFVDHKDEIMLVLGEISKKYGDQ